jgi:hypothetical protein
VCIISAPEVILFCTILYHRLHHPKVTRALREHHQASREMHPGDMRATAAMIAAFIGAAVPWFTADGR